MSVLWQWIGISVLVMIVAVAGAVVGAQEGGSAKRSNGMMMSPSVTMPIHASVGR